MDMQQRTIMPKLYELIKYVLTGMQLLQLVQIIATISVAQFRGMRGEDISNLEEKINTEDKEVVIAELKEALDDLPDSIKNMTMADLFSKRG